MSRSMTSRRWRLVAAAPAIGLVVAGAATGGGVTSSAAAVDRPVVDSSDLQETYINYVAPNAEKATGGDVKVGKKGQKSLVDPEVLAEAKAVDAKHAGGYPVAARELAKAEQKAIKTGKSPRKFKQAPTQQKAQLLTILVEFDDQKTYDWSGVMVPKTVFGDRTCIPAANVPNGPLHNNIPNPADFKATTGAIDNNSFWVDDFSPEHFDKMLYSTEGITERIRPDLPNPEAKSHKGHGKKKMGIDISGYTMKNMYEEMSKGAYTVDGAATDWVKVDNSEAYYAADTCTQNADGTWEAGRIQDMNGYPGSGGAGKLAVDAVNALADQQPDFPFSDYDVEDQGDRDGDGNFFEPDGVIDHVVLVHAGEDKSGGGGKEGTYAIWAHSSAVPGGAPVGDTGLKVSNYIVQPEDSGVGVFAHEYGHDLGLPDLYDVASGGESDVDFWDLMSSGSHSGPIFQSMPTHMGIWDKWVLGWANPLTVNPGDKARTVDVGQTSRTPERTEDGIKINLPNKVVTLAEPHSGENMWWSSNDQTWADNTNTRTVAVPSGTDVKFRMWNNYVIEADWDFGFVEVSTDGGSTWTEQKVYDSTGALVSTDDGYGDPNGNLGDSFGGKKYGLTGDSHGWRHDYIDLAPFAGQTVQVRLRYATDAAFAEKGWFADDFSVTNGSTTVWSDDVESGANGWTAARGTWVDGTPLGAGWIIDSGTSERAQYYLAEWRNFDGFDEGLKYAYDTTYQSFGPWKVEKIKYNAPGMLVWYRDTTYGDQNSVLATTYDLPSVGSKGGLLIVDSHFDPLRRTGTAAAKDPSTLNNVPSRPQSSNAAFGSPTYPFKECLAEVPGEDWKNEYCTSFGPQPHVAKFTDSKGWYPGLEQRDDGAFFFRDVDASTVLPNGSNEPYSVRIVDQNGKPLPDLYGEDLGLGVPLGTGNPTKPYGVSLTVERSIENNTIGKIRVQPAK